METRSEGAESAPRGTRVRGDGTAVPEGGLDACLEAATVPRQVSVDVVSDSLVSLQTRRIRTFEPSPSASAALTPITGPPGRTHASASATPELGAQVRFGPHDRIVRQRMLIAAVTD